MQLTEKEATASLRTLVCVAKADGTITSEEREALTGALGAIPGTQGGLGAYLDETPDLQKVLAELTSPEAREKTYQSAYGLAYADGQASPEEVKLLETIRTTLQIGEEQASITRRVFEEAKDTVMPSAIEPIADPALRQKEIREDVLKYSVLSAVLGAFPVPGIAIATDLAIVGLQLKLVRDIGQYWGHKVDKQAAKSLLGGLGLGTGARIAVSNLAKLVPGWGSAFGATSAFATTWALGKIADRYFESGGKIDLNLLRKELKDAEKEGRDAYAQNQSTIDAKRRDHEAKLADLNTQLKSGALTQDEYERRVAALA